MAVERAVVGALTHAELVDPVVRRLALIDRLKTTVAEQQALIRRLEARSASGSGSGTATTRRRKCRA